MFWRVPVPRGRLFFFMFINAPYVYRFTLRSQRDNDTDLCQLSLPMPIARLTRPPPAPHSLDTLTEYVSLS